MQFKLNLPLWRGKARPTETAMKATASQRYQTVLLQRTLPLVVEYFQEVEATML
jgi:hypothetical protein